MTLLRAYAIVYGGVILFSTIHNLSTAAAGWLVGARIEKISFFSGRKLAIRGFRGRLELGLFPWPCGFVQFFSDESGDATAAFSNLHPLRQLLISIAGCVVVLMLALICLGPSRGALSLWRGFDQIVRGGLHPETVPAALIRAFVAVISVSSIPTVLGIVAAKQTAFNLLPVPPLNGGQIILILLEWRRRLPEHVRNGAHWAGVMAAMYLAGVWAFAATYVAVRDGLR